MRRLACAALAAAALTAGCGQKGPLFLPAQAGTPARAPAGPAASTPAAPASAATAG